MRNDFTLLPTRLIFYYKRISWYRIILVLLLGVCFWLTLNNLNYNSPFNDEAIYVVIGRMGLFQRDWTTYSAQNWMAGSQFFYPPLTAIAYSLGGITASRFISIIFGLLAIISLSWIAKLISSSQARLTAPIITTAVFGLSSVSLYLSRLATYDIAGYSLFFLSYALLLYSPRSTKPARNYFLSATCLVLSYLFNFTTIAYIPFVVLLSFFEASKHRLFRKYWLIYFLFPLVSSGVIYLLLELRPTLTYIKVQATRENIPFRQVIDEFLLNSRLVWPLAALGVLGMLFKKNWRQLIILLFFSFLILLIHLFIHRLSTLDKHTYLSVAFASIIAAVGITEFMVKIQNRIFQTLFIVLLLFALTVYGVASYQSAQRYNKLWENANILMDFLAYQQKPGDKILVEAGPQLILASYEVNYPSNISTFDWFEYKGQKGFGAYSQAVADGYFDYIQLNSDYKLKNPVYTEVHTRVSENLDENYDLIFRQDYFYVYKNAHK